MTVSLRASVSFDRTSNELHIAATELGEDESGKPLLLTYSPKKDEITVQSRLQLVLSETNVGEVTAIHHAATTQNAGKLGLKFTVKEQELDLADDIRIGNLCEDIFDEVIEQLSAIDPTLPIPLFLPMDVKQRSMNATLCCVVANWSH
ncbi:MAG: hypothetical protein R3B91_07065 [Planctomycetaceae bacterium]